MRVVDVLTLKLKEHSLTETKTMDSSSSSDIELVRVAEEKTPPVDSGTESDAEDEENSDPESGEIQAILNEDRDNQGAHGVPLLPLQPPSAPTAFKRPLQQSNRSSFQPVVASVSRRQQHTSMSSPASSLSSPCMGASTDETDYDRFSSEEELAGINSGMMVWGRSAPPREKRTWEQANDGDEQQQDMHEPVRFSSSPPKGVFFTRTESPRVFLERVAPSTCMASAFASPAKRHRQCVLDDVGSPVPPRPSLDFEKMQAQVHCC